MASRGSVVSRSRTKKKKGKPVCELGANCPYIHQYQHSLEFTHEDNETSVTEGSNNSFSSFQAFSGSGRTLPTSASNSGGIASNVGRSTLNSSSNLLSAAALAATRRAAENAGGLEQEAKPLRLKRHDHDNNRKKNTKASKEEAVISIDDSSSDDESSSKKSSKLPLEKRRKISNGSKNSDIIDLCNRSD